ncbi:MAG TPA: hypothetical protein DCE43_24410, partial [Planctomycetaceae bacterium]|nr:hypothetical protein [Planctomycetaceae bacterium]
PNHLAANHQLAQALDRLGQPVRSIRFRQRAQHLSELVTLLRGLSGNPRYGNERTEQRVRQVVELNKTLGRAWEAVAWSMFALQNNQSLQWPQDYLKDLRPYITKSDMPRTVEKLNVISSIDLSDLPVPNWTTDATTQNPTGGVAQSGFGPIRFRNDAVATGLQFNYYSDRAEEIEASRLPETIGGGAGVVDFDGDG